MQGDEQQVFEVYADESREQSVAFTFDKTHARLIAAAPELLEALQACLAALNNEGRYQGERTQAWRAIAKATGA